MHIFSTDESESKEFLAYENLSQVCSTDEGKSERVIFDEISMEESQSECVQKIINKEKYANNKTEHEETSVTDNPFVKEPMSFNLFKCGKKS